MNKCLMCKKNYAPARDGKGLEINPNYCEKCLEIQE